MENRTDEEIMNQPASGNTEDLSFLAETGVLEKLTEAASEETPQTDLSETQVFERLTDGQDDLSSSETAKEEEEQEKEEKKSFRSSAVKEVLLFIRDLAIHLAIVLLIVNFVIRPIQVRGSSMYPTLTSGSLGVSNLIGYNTDGIRRFDIVIIYMEEKNEYLVKRAIGLPGETVSYQDGILYINGEAMAEDFLDEEYVSSYDGHFMEDVEEITLGEDEYFCLGDNRPHSTDSRYYGPFKKSQIISKGVFIFWPFSSFGAETW